MSAPEDEHRPHTLVRRSFGPNAPSYSTSAVHRDSAALSRLVARVAPRAEDRVLDVATGAGHTALAFAPVVASVVAADVTVEMLAEVRRNASARGVGNVAVVQAAAEALPLASGSVDVAVCRIATHHFADLPAAIGEMARVLAPRGRVAIFDSTVPEDDELDREINVIERLRDPSHVRNVRASEWRTLIADAGLSLREIDECVYEGESKSFNDWTARLRTQADTVAILRRMLETARPALRDVLKIGVEENDIRFALPRIFVIAARPD